MDNQTAANLSELKSLPCNLGLFEGFNCRTQTALDHLVSAEAVVNWDHDQEGEAEFWPAGEVPEVALIFKHRSSVTAAELLDLDRVLVELGGDSRYNFLQIHYPANLCGDALPTLGLTRFDGHLGGGGHYPKAHEQKPQSSRRHQTGRRPRRPRRRAAPAL